MLLGKHLGRGEHRGLAARIGNLQHGAQSHHSLTGTHITLQQAVHGRFTRQIRGNLSAHLLLPLGQLVGQNLNQPIGEAALHGGARLSQVRGTHRMQAGERALQHERLAVTHLRLRGTPSVLRIGGVQGAVRPLQRGHLAGATNRVGYRVFEFFERHLFEQLRHVAANAVGGQLHGGAVDGHGGGGGVGDVRAGGVLREQGVVWVGEGVFAAVDADPAGEHHGFALVDFAGGGPGVEEGELHLRADERTGIRHAGHAKEASLREIILAVAVCVAAVGGGLRSPTLCRVLGSWVLPGVSERVNARVVHPGCLPVLRGRTGYSGYAGCTGYAGYAGAVSAPGHHGYRTASPKTSGTKTGSPKTCGCVLPGGVGEPVGDGHFRDFAAACRHGSGAHVHHAGDDGDVLALNEFGEGAELTARQVLAREVFEHLPDGVQVQVRGDCLSAGCGKVLFERRIFDAVFGGVARQGTAFSLRGCRCGGCSGLLSRNLLGSGLLRGSLLGRSFLRGAFRRSGLGISYLLRRGFRGARFFGGLSRRLLGGSRLSGGRFLSGSCLLRRYLFDRRLFSFCLGRTLLRIGHLLHRLLFALFARLRYLLRASRSSPNGSFTLLRARFVLN